MPFDWTGLETSLPPIIAGAAGLSAGKVIWESQSSPRPALPYVSLWHTQAARLSPLPEVLSSVNPAGVPGNPAANPPTIGTELLSEYRAPSEMVLRVQAYSASPLGASSAEKLLQTLSLALDLSAVRSSLETLGLVVVDRAPVIALPSLVETRFEGHAALDIRLRLLDGVSEAGTYIGQAEITPRYNGTAGAPFRAPEETT